MDYKRTTSRSKCHHWHVTCCYRVFCFCKTEGCSMLVLNDISEQCIWSFPTIWVIWVNKVKVSKETRFYFFPFAYCVSIQAAEPNSTPYFHIKQSSALLKVEFKYLPNKWKDHILVEEWRMGDCWMKQRKWMRCNNYAMSGFSSFSSGNLVCQIRLLSLDRRLFSGPFCRDKLKLLIKRRTRWMLIQLSSENP